MPELVGVQAGDELTIVDISHANRGIYGTETVTKVGRRWVYTSGNTRYDLETGLQDRGDMSSTTEAWLSRTEYDEYVAATQMWKELLFALRYRARPPRGVTRENVEQAAKLLKLELLAPDGSRVSTADEP